MHYVVVFEDNSLYENRREVLAVKHTAEEAKGILKAKVREIRKDLDDKGWEVLCDQDDLFDAGVSDEYDCSHTLIYVAEVAE